MPNFDVHSICQKGDWKTIFQYSISVQYDDGERIIKNRFSKKEKEREKNNKLNHVRYISLCCGKNRRFKNDVIMQMVTVEEGNNRGKKRKEKGSNVAGRI